jgi:hypothetical protein
MQQVTTFMRHGLTSSPTSPLPGRTEGFSAVQALTGGCRRGIHCRAAEIAFAKQSRSKRKTSPACDVLNDTNAVTRYAGARQGAFLGERLTSEPTGLRAKEGWFPTTGWRARTVD